MILAGIDIGTNTLRLLVAEISPGSFRELYSERRITRLGRDLDRTGALSPDAQERSMQALLGFAEAIRRHDAVHVAAVGTSALRNARNSAEYLVEVKNGTGISISVITGEEEARLTVLGVSRALSNITHKDGLPASAFVIDIGGGSTELVVATPEHTPRSASLPLGAVYLTERFIRHDPPSPDEVKLLRHAIKESLDRHSTGISPDPNSVFIGTAGTITTLAAMDQGLVTYDPNRINGYAMTKTTIDEIIAKLGTSTLAQRKAFPGLEQAREDIILAGALVTQEIMEQFGFGTMIVSDWGLREGIVLDLYDKITAGPSSSKH
jgi:exopolyphosphatase / guanosine-5'-triphosphate,3'-diphosphate pyrophosphatase